MFFDVTFSGTSSSFLSQPLSSFIPTNPPSPNSSVHTSRVSVMAAVSTFLWPPIFFSYLHLHQIQILQGYLHSGVNVTAILHRIQSRSKCSISTMTSFLFLVQLNFKMLKGLAPAFIITGLFQYNLHHDYTLRSHIFTLMLPYFRSFGHIQFYFQSYHFSFICCTYVFVRQSSFLINHLYKMACGFITGRQGSRLTKSFAVCA